MKNNSIDRRTFCSALLPACALGCMGMACLTPEKVQAQSKQNKPKHKFGGEFKMTYAKAYKWKYNTYIDKMEEMALLMGQEKLFHLLKKSADNRHLKRAKDGADFSLKQWAENLLNNEYFKNVNTLSFPVLTEERCEVEITECLWAKTFRAKNAGELGYANTCYGDYALFRSMHPKLKLERDKTLMQGHNICNGTLTFEG